jgi:mRNA interferase RelE/StbE
MPWEPEIGRRARRELERLPERDRAAVETAIARLADDPGSVDPAKLGGRGDEWRMRVGNWRVIVELDNTNGVIRILRVLRRTSTTY